MQTGTGRGKFQKGDDPRRHKFTRAECQKGYQAAWQSLERRFPGCDPHFLMCAIISSRPWHLLLADVDSEAELLRRCCAE